MIIRSETSGDVAAIRIVEEVAFGRADEARLIDDLRDAGDSVFSLVAVDGDTVVGHVLFSRMKAPFPALALAPVAVQPEYRRTGIGSRLIQTGLRQLRRQGAAGCVVLGEPDYYQRFGFRHDPTMVLRGVPPEYFMVLPFQPRSGKDAQREVTYHSSFYALD